MRYLLDRPILLIVNENCNDYNRAGINFVM